MADIYVVYTGADKAWALRLVGKLRARWSVWWDEDLVGPYTTGIESEMPRAGCVVLVNSEVARDRPHVIDELNLARDAGKTIIPAQIDTAKPPYGYGTLSGAALMGWDGEEDHDGWRLLQHKIAQVVPPRARPARPDAILSGRLPLPVVFMSASSHETQLSPEDAVGLARIFGTHSVLVSAYDWTKGRATKKRTDALAALKAAGSLVLMDSGNYEAMRRGDKRWTPERYAQTLATAPHDLACSFDVLPVPVDQAKHLDALIAAVERDKALTSAPIVPIVHCPVVETGGYDRRHLPEILCSLARSVQPPLLAVPERELGEGLIERVRTMMAIREALDALPFYQPVHLLGTGNPWSIAALAAAGADSFDGLEWCRVVVDRDASRLNHFQHYDLFARQAAISPVVAAAAAGELSLPFAARAALHNLDYYADFGDQLRDYAKRGGLETLVTGLLGGPNTRLLAEKAPGIFR